jgi:hypothetical protein
MIEQLQDLEYKLAGACKNVNARMGSCTFGHGAMILWDKKAYEVRLSPLSWSRKAERDTT